jgi:hypothetical protein
MGFPMSAAPTDREIHVLATRFIPGLGAVDEVPFHVMARFYPEHGYWAAEDRPGNGLPSLGLIPLEPECWYL